MGVTNVTFYKIIGELNVKKKFKKYILLLLILIIVVVIGIILKNNNTKIKIVDNLKTTEIPKLYIIGNIDKMMEKSDQRKIKIEYKSYDKSFEAFALLKVQGAMTLKFDKKNYNITFYQDNEYNKKMDIDLKWGKMNKYTLKANWLDQFHSRNIVTAQIASDINKKYGILTNSINYGLTDGFPIEIYDNSDFLGLYTLNIAKDYILNMDKKDENNIAILGKPLRFTKFDELETNEWINYDVEYGEDNKKTLNKLNRLIQFVAYSTDIEFVNDFEKYFNLDSVLNYYCLMQYAQLTDNVTRNIFLITYDGNIWYTGLYDLELSWGNEYSGQRILQHYDNENMKKMIEESFLWKRFEKLFSDKIRDRYKILRSEILTKDNVIKKMNNFYNLIPKETLKKEYNKWNNEPNYDLSYLEEYINNRTSIVDKAIGYNL